MADMMFQSTPLREGRLLPYILMNFSALYNHICESKTDAKVGGCNSNISARISVSAKDA